MLHLMPNFACNRTKTGSNIDPVELELAQQNLLLLIQKESFSLQRKRLLNSSPIHKTLTILKLSPFIELNGLLRGKGRTHLLKVATFGTKRPVILDARHPLVRLFLQHLLERHCHHAVEYLRALTQQNFSILKLLTTLKSIQLKCVTCRKLKVETVTPIMVDVPQRRIAFRSLPAS